MTQDDARQQLLAIVHDEVTKNDKGQFWITDKVAFNMREMIKEFRNMYWGVYEKPIDPVSGRERLWVPLTRLLVDSVRKSVDLDPKDIRFRSKNPSRTQITHVVRGFVRQLLSRRYFNHTMNQDIFRMAIDGTAVRKTYMVDGMIKWRDVDVLNCYIDPTAESIQSAYRFTERVLMTDHEVRKMDWENTATFKVQKDLESQDGNASRKTGEYGDVYEMWGLVPRNLFKAAMGEEYNEDGEDDIEVHVVVSGFDTGNILFHLVEENTNKDKDGNIIKPYEEAWYIKAPGCWYGVSIPWMVMQLQTWINTTVNLRIAKNTVAQLGLIKVKRGSGVTQQMLTNLISKGVIEVADPENDIQNMVIAEAGQSSYTDEEVAKNWAQEVTSVFDINLANLPASTSATGAVIQDHQSRSAFALVTESYEDFTQRWMDRHVLPNVPTMMKKEGMSTIFKDFEDIRQIRETVVSNLALQAIMDQNITPTDEEIQKAMQEAADKLERRGDLLVDVVDDIIAKELETEVFMTNAEVDVAVAVRNLLELRNGIDPQAAAEMTAEAIDLLGFQVPQSLRNPQPQPTAQPKAPDVQSSVQQVTNANTLSNEQR